MSKLAGAAPAPGRNPFPKVPEVTVGFSDHRGTTVETDAVRNAATFVDRYSLGQAGRSLAIIADYGAGKSHLADVLTWNLRDKSPGGLICVIRIQSDDTLHSIYRRIFEQYHSHAEDEAISIFVREGDISRRIKKVSHEIMPVNAAAAGLDSSSVATSVDLTHALQDRLFEIVKDREFADGLSLLLHEDQEIVGHAWDWLRGGPVTSDIAKRGVEEPIENEPRAMLAMLVLARLVSHAGAPFALIVDDIERLGGEAEDAHHNLASALNLLFRWAADSGSLLVVSGLASAWEDLPEGVHQRVGRVIRPEPFTKADIASYQRKIYQDQDITSGPRFTNGAFARLRDITGGSPRQVVDVCYHAFSAAAGETVTASLIDEVSDDILVRTPPRAAAARVAELCAGLGQRATPGPVVGETIVQLRIPVGSADAGCLIVVTGPVVNSFAARKLIRVVRERAGNSEESAEQAAILVCTGPVAESRQEELREAFTHVLRFDQDDFWRDLSMLISHLVATLSTQAEVSLLRDLRDDLRVLRAQQAGEHEFLRKLADDGRESEKRLRGVVRDETRRAYLRLPGNADVLEFGEDRPELQRLFDQALVPIREALERSEQLWRSMFVPGERDRLIDRSRAPGERAALPADLTREDVTRTLGALTALSSSVDGFGRAVRGLLQGADQRHSHRAQLRYQRDRFDQAVEDLLLLIPASDEDPNSVVYRMLGIQRGSIILRLKGLGAAVYDKMYDEDFRHL